MSGAWCLPLRPFQRSALKLLERSGHVVCIAPTGSGKSRIYEELLAREGPRMLLFSPLVALARQQERSLTDRGIAVFGSGLNRSRPRRGESGVWSLRPE